MYEVPWPITSLETSQKSKDAELTIPDNVDLDEPLSAKRRLLFKTPNKVKNTYFSFY